MIKVFFALLIATLFTFRADAQAVTSNLNRVEIPNRLIYFTTNITAGSTASGVLDTGGVTLMAIRFPAAMTGTTVSFLQCESSTQATCVPITDLAGAAYTVTVVNSSYRPVNPTVFAGVRWMQISVNATEAATRTIGLSLKGVGF